MELGAQSRPEPGLPGLTEGEYLDSVLHLTHGLQDGVVGDGEQLILTASRLTLIQARGRNRRTAFAAVDDIGSVEVVEERNSFGGYVWGLLAITVGVLLWFTIDNRVGSAAAAIAVFTMGGYLIFDRLSDSATTRVTFKVGNSDLSCELQGPDATQDIHTFVDRVFELKEGNGSRQRLAARKWTLR